MADSAALRRCASSIAIRHSNGLPPALICWVLVRDPSAERDPQAVCAPIATLTPGRSFPDLGSAGGSKPPLKRPASRPDSRINCRRALQDGRNLGREGGSGTLRRAASSRRSRQTQSTARPVLQASGPACIGFRCVTLHNPRHAAGAAIVTRGRQQVCPSGRPRPASPENGGAMGPDISASAEPGCIKAVDTFRSL
jgi:hypothetical protein